MVLALAATLLAAAPSTSHTELRMRLDVGGLVGASWYVPQTRRSLLLALDNAKGSFFGPETIQLSTTVNAVPIVGPLLMLNGAAGEDRAMLITTAALQLLGTTVALKRLVLETGVNDKPHSGPELTFSPIVAGQLGFAVRLTGF
ncbi:MAG: hypothetical protein QM817_15790 [Archangium sp.]